MNYTRSDVMSLDQQATKTYVESSVAHTVKMLVSDVISLQQEVKLARLVIEKALIESPDRTEWLKTRDRLRTIQENFDA